MAQQQQTNGAAFNALTSGSKIIGTVIADSDFRIDGTIEGNIQCNGKVVIGERGTMKGDVIAQSAEVQGHMEGKLDVKQTLALRANSHLQGDIKTVTLIVEPGAVFNGSCEMGKRTQAAPQAAPQQK